MKKYRVTTVARYFDQYVIEAENTTDATELALDRAREDHEKAGDVMRAGSCIRIDTNPNTVEPDAVVGL